MAGDSALVHGPPLRPQPVDGTVGFRPALACGLCKRFPLESRRLETLSLPSSLSALTNASLGSRPWPPLFATYARSPHPPQGCHCASPWASPMPRLCVSLPIPQRCRCPIHLSDTCVFLLVLPSATMVLFQFFLCSFFLPWLGFPLAPTFKELLMFVWHLAN